ncbi:MAG: hypothetical protein RBG13Loki_1251 [Promethearchaeota archaeon CR_4]|nr:MAG: hypothetical protein RBG13Loki_1251 [Candidatus Lokiarchaeota archaeon CR_4]
MNSHMLITSGPRLMKINIEADSKVRAGFPANVQMQIELPEPKKVFWGGVKLITKRPCKNPLVIASKDVFSQGFFDSGTYNRQLQISIAQKILPSVELRNIVYTIDGCLRVEKAPKSDEELEIVSSRSIIIDSPLDKTTAPSPNPVNFSLGGLTITLNKDVYAPGEAIKVSYQQKGFRQISVKLMQLANVVCSCPQFGHVCTYLEKSPAVVTNANKKDLNSSDGFILLKIPKISEPSHKYQWKPSEETFWGHQFGDVNEWFIDITGKYDNPTVKSIKFQVPITILPNGTTSGDHELFAPGKSNVDFKPKSRPKNVFEVTTPRLDSQNRTFEIKITNRLPSKTLTGVTIKATGVQEGLFETPSYMQGIATWASGEIKTILYRTQPNVTNIVLVIEDNDFTQTRLVAPVA